MKRILGITTAALMGASVLAAPAFAQADYDTQQGEDAGAVTMPDVDTGTTAAIDGSSDGALTAIGSSSVAAQSLGTMTDVQSVNVVRVGELEGSDPMLIEETVSQNDAGVQELRQAISANASLSQELEAQGVSSAEVVGAEIGLDGDVTVYVM